MSELYAAAYHNIVQSVLEGALTPFLGAGANLSGRPEGAGFERGRNLPSGEELARLLSLRFDYPPDRGSAGDLVRVSQFASVAAGERALTRYLHEIFENPCPPTPVHTWLASVPGHIRALRAEPDRRFPLVITANYDDSLEQAFDAVEEPYDLIAYHRGRLIHWVCEPGRPREAPVEIGSAKEYIDVDPDRRTVLLKVHGLVDREGFESFVITEDHYIDYLTRLDPEDLLPPHILGRLRDSDFLFLGYSLRDWNVRAILKQIWDEQIDNGKNWAVLKEIAVDDENMWRTKSVDILKQPLDAFVREVQAELDELGARELPVEHP